MEKDEEKMVEIARFSRIEDAEALKSLLLSEDIDCYVRNEFTTQVMGIIDMGGARVELLESNVEKALQVMKDNGYEIPNEEETPEDVENDPSKNKQGLLHKFPFEKQLIIFFIIIAICLAILIFTEKLFVPN